MAIIKTRKSRPLSSIYLRIGLLVLPLVVWQVIELFVLPIDAFTYRAWEALIVYSNMSLPGPFYPNMDLQKMEAGNHDPHGPRTKAIRFRTDQYGYRNSEDYVDGRQFDIVMLGDSNIVGSHTDQKDTLTEQVTQRCGLSTYNYGSGVQHNLATYIRDPRFIKTPPKAVFLEIRRGDIEFQNVKPIVQCPINTELEKTRGEQLCVFDTPYAQWKALQKMRLPIWLGILIDRFDKQVFYNYLSGRLKLSEWKNDPTVGLPDIEKRIEYTTTNLSQYAKVFHEHGSRFMVYLMPSEDRRFDSIVEKLEKNGIEVIGFLPTSEFPHGADMEHWWLADDSHWHEEAIRTSARLVCDQFAKAGKAEDQSGSVE